MKRKKTKLPILIEKMKKTLFDISCSKMKFRCKEDEVFFEDQKDKRLFFLGYLDRKDNARINMNQRRKERDRRKAKKTGDIYIKEVPELSVESNESPWEPQRATSRVSDVVLTVDKRKWLRNVCAVADKTISSDRSALQLAVAAVSSSKGAQDLTFSVSTMWRQRKKVRADIAGTVKTAFVEELQQNHRYILHWDEKLLKGRRHVDRSHEYMAVVLTNVVTGKV